MVFARSSPLRRHLSFATHYVAGGVIYVILLCQAFKGGQAGEERLESLQSWFDEKFEFSYGYREDQEASQKLIAIAPLVIQNDYRFYDEEKAARAYDELMGFIRTKGDTVSAASACLLLASLKPFNLKSRSVVKKIRDDHRLLRWQRILAQEDIYRDESYQLEGEAYGRQWLKILEEQKGDFEYLDSIVLKTPELVAVASTIWMSAPQISFRTIHLFSIEGIYHDLHQWDHAQAILEQILRENPRHWPTYKRVKEARRELIRDRESIENPDPQNTVWVNYHNKAVLKYGNREDPEASRRLQEILRGLNWDTRRPYVIPPLLDFAQKHAGTTSAATACLLLVQRAEYPDHFQMKDLKAAASFWREMVQSEDLRSWQRILAERFLFDEENRSGKPDYAKKKLDWYGTWAPKAKQLDEQLKTDAELQLFTKLAFDDLAGPETRYAWECELDRIALFAQAGRVDESLRCCDELGKAVKGDWIYQGRLDELRDAILKIKGSSQGK